MDIVKALFKLDKSSGISGYLRESTHLVAEYFNFPLHGLISKDPSIPEMLGNIAERQFRALESVVLKTLPGQVFVINDTLPSPWGEIARIGFKSLAVIPIIQNDSFAGAIVFPDKKRHDFTDKAAYQLDCVSFMISNAISIIRQKSETGKFELKFSNSLDPAAIITDENDIITQANLEYVNLSGNNASQIIGSKWNSDQLQKDIAPLPALDQIDKSKFPLAYEACLTRQKLKVYCICTLLAESPKKLYQHFIMPVSKQVESSKHNESGDIDLAKELTSSIDRIIRNANPDEATISILSDLGTKIKLDRISLVKISQDQLPSTGIQMIVEMQWASNPQVPVIDYNQLPFSMIVAKYASGIPVPINIDSVHGMKSTIVAPAFLSGKLWGFITAENLEQRNWSHQDVMYWSLFAQFLANHIENTRLIEFLRADYEANRQMLLGYSTSIAILAHRDNKIIDVSKGFSYLSGWMKEDVTGKTTIDIDLYCVKEQQSEIFDSLAKNGRVIDKELLIKTKEGRTKNVLLSAEIIAVKGQKYIVTSHKDITMIREVEQSLKRSEEQVKTIINSIPERILIIDEKGSIAKVQNGLNGLDFDDESDPEKLLGRNFADIIPASAQKKYQQVVEALKHDKKTKIIEFETDGKGKPKSFYEARMSITNSNEIVAIISNITENRLYRQNLDKVQDKFYNVFHFSPIGIAILDSNCQKILNCNNRFAKLAQTDIGGIIGKNLSDFEILKNNPRIVDFLEQLPAENTNINFEIDLIGQKNKNVACLFTGTKATIGFENVFIIMISDISELKQARMDLVESDERFRLTVLNTNFPSMISDLDTGNIVLFNDDFCKMTELPRTKIAGASLTSLAFMTKEKYQSFLHDLEEYGTIKNRIDTFNLPDGRQLNIIYSSETIKFMGKKCILSTYQDITPLENANKAIHESEEKYRLLVENSPLGTLTIDFDGRILSVNRAMLGIIGIQNASNLVDTNIANHSIFTQSGIAEDFSYCCQTLEPYVSERTIRVNDSDLYLVIYSTPYSNQDGVHRRIQMILEDITITKMVEMELKKAISQAESASSAKSEFLANMSHEIRTPLNALLGFVQLMSSDVKDEKQRQYISAIETAAQALNSMTASLLDISKIEAGKISIEYSPNDLAELIRDSILLTEHKSKESGNTIVFDFNNQPSTYMIDPDRFKQIMINLLGNATKFTKKGMISVSLSINKGLDNYDSITIDVDDTGIGIPREMYDIVFEPFMQVDSSATRKFGGTGLGLAIVKGLVEKMNGTITIVEKRRPGTKFRINLTLERVMSQTVRVVKSKDVVLWLDDENAYETFRVILSKTSLQIHRHQSLPENLKFIKFVVTDHFNKDAAINADKGILPPFIFVGVEENSQKWAGLPKPVEKNAALIAISRLFPDEPELAYLNLIGKQILIVEDNQLNIMLLKDILSRMGCQTTVSMSGFEAVELIKRGGFDACLMDVQMPDLSGLDATMQVRYFEETTTRNRLPIIALTAYATNEDRDRCINAGMDDFVAKPFKMGDLLSTITKAIHLSHLESQKSVIQKLAERLLIDQDKLREFMGNFVTSSINSLSSLDSMIQNDEFPAALKITHTIKGMAYVEDLHKAIVKLESSLRKQDKELSMIELHELRNMLTNLSKEITS